MVRKVIIGVLLFIYLSALTGYARADGSVAFDYYYKHGVEAYAHHQENEALRLFKIAAIYEPDNADLKHYLDDLESRGIILSLAPSSPLELNPQQYTAYHYYLLEARHAVEAHQYDLAVRNFEIALIYNPSSKEAQEFLGSLTSNQVLHNTHPLLASTENTAGSLTATAPVKSEEALPTQQNTSTKEVLQTSQSTPTEEVLPTQQSAPTPVPSSSYAPSVNQQVAAPGAVSFPPRGSQTRNNQIYIQAPAASNRDYKPRMFSLDELTNSGALKPKMQIEWHSSIILEGRNIHRFLVVDEGFLGVHSIDTDRLQIDALKIGTTFIHIWDDRGMRSLYIQVIFPKAMLTISPQINQEILHAAPFSFVYSNQYSTSYSGKDFAGLKRQNYQFEQNLSMAGETPYGIFDASGDYSDDNSIKRFDTYTMGLSQIPLKGTSDFNIRAFDATRELSPLTMPSTTLRGVFADVDLFSDVLGVSFSHGSVQEPYGFFSIGQTGYSSAMIDAYKLTLFPKSETDRYSINVAYGYGSNRSPYLANHNYSIEGQHKFNPNLTLNAETASDTNHDAETSSLKWQNNMFRSVISFKNINKNFATVSAYPSSLGETGGEWTTDLETDRLSESTYFEAYQDHLDPNPNHPRALNYNANGHLRYNLTPHIWTDSDFSYYDTGGELSPQHSLSVSQRVSRGFGVWGGMTGSVYTGIGYQNSHSSDVLTTDYRREGPMVGIQLPLTHQLSTYVNYEYDWLNQYAIDSGNSNPNVLNAGLEYTRQITPKFSIDSSVNFRDELGVSGTNTYLSGEESLMFSAGLSYNPTPDISFFGNCSASRVISHLGNPAYEDVDAQVGMRITFGTGVYWDPTGTVTGIVFKDANGDGKYVRTDEGIAGIKIKVGNQTALTDKNGRYRIHVKAKGVMVTPQQDTLPGGLIFSTPQVQNVIILQGRTIHADFGLISQTGIYGIIFVDKTGSGTPTDGDRFINKVKIILDGKIIQKSDSHGAFYFRNVAPGKHTIALDINSISLDLLPQIKIQNQINVEEGTNYVFNVPLKEAK